MLSPHLNETKEPSKWGAQGQLYKKALKLGFEGSDVHYNLAEVCWHVGKKAEALDQLEKQLKEKPNDARALRLRDKVQRGEKPRTPGQ